MSLCFLILQIRNEPADEFLGLLKQWDKLCKTYIDKAGNKTMSSPRVQRQLQSPKSNDSRNKNKKPSAEYEVASIVDICYGDPNQSGKHGLHFEVGLICQNI